LSQREREIFHRVVECYLASGEPVASAQVAGSSNLGLSAATIRNVMAELERKGLLRQPHTSAGREPSDEGIREYVSSLLQVAALTPAERRRLRQLLLPAASLSEALGKASKVLAQVTVEVGMAVTSAPRRAALRSIHFVRVAARRVLAVVITQGGVVDSRLLAVERDYDSDELERISNYCTHNFAGVTLEEIRERLLALMAEDRAQCDALLSGVIELGQQVVESESSSPGEIYLEGTERLFEKVVPAQLEALRHLFAAFSEKATLVNLLNRYLSQRGPRVVIGSELAIGGRDDLGLIVTSFSVPSGESGLVGVIGLKRMDYGRIIPVVDFVGHYLSGVGDEVGSVQ
jgi:heat-inducible transcriptional repressor